MRCDRSADPSSPRWVTSSGSREPRCTYECLGHGDCREGWEKCVNHRCVDLTCATADLVAGGRAAIVLTSKTKKPGEKNNAVGATATVTCSHGHVLRAAGGCRRAVEVTCAAVGDYSGGDIDAWVRWVLHVEKKKVVADCVRGLLAVISQFRLMCYGKKKIFVQDA